MGPKAAGVKGGRDCSVTRPIRPYILISLGSQVGGEAWSG